MTLPLSSFHWLMLVFDLFVTLQLVLEGWQRRLDPSVSVFACLDKVVGGGMIGTFNKVNAWLHDFSERSGLHSY